MALPGLRVSFSANFLVFTYALLAGFVILAIQVASVRSAVPVAFPGELFVWQIFTLILAGVFFAGLVIRKIMLRAFWELVLTVTLFLGAWVYAWFLFPFEIALLFASILTILQARLRRVAMHDFFMLVGGAGMALNFAYLFQDHILIPFFVALIIYDMFAGRPKGVAAELASSLIHRGVIPGLIVPARAPHIFANIKQAISDPDAVFLGAGDLVLPMILVARATVLNITYGVFVGISILVAAFWLGSRGPTKPYPALIPLGIGAIVPYLVILAIEQL